MPRPKFTLFVAAGLAALLAFAALAAGTPVFTVDPAIAAMTPDQKVRAREAAMKQDGGALRVASKAMGADAVTQIDLVLQNFANFPALFSEDTKDIRSGALPPVWDHHDDFLAIFAKGRTDLLAMRAAALGTNKAAYAAALKKLGGVCFECHQTYREPDTN